jgi:hypothetical protein
MSAPTITADDYLRAVEAGADGLAEWYAEHLEAPLRRAAEWYERPDAIALSAVHYARRGLKVLPLAPAAKRPLGPVARDCCAGSHRRGCLDASSDVEVVSWWWRVHPTANLGIATGHLVDVIDQDGAPGARSWLEILAAGTPPEVLGVVSTPRDGGVHRYVAATGSGNGAGIAPGLDYRGRGGYVVAPPSVVDGRRYSWVRSLELAR